MPSETVSGFPCSRYSWLRQTSRSCCGQPIARERSYSINEAQRIVDSVNEVRIPIVAEVDGFVRVQNTNLDAREKALVVLYYKQPTKVEDSQLSTWVKYANPSRFKTTILKRMDAEALIHYEAGLCTLLPKGIRYLEENVALNVLV